MKPKKQFKSKIKTLPDKQESLVIKSPDVIPSSHIERENNAVSNSLKEFASEMFIANIITTANDLYSLLSEQLSFDSVPMSRCIEIMNIVKQEYEESRLSDIRHRFANSWEAHLARNGVNKNYISKEILSLIANEEDHRAKAAGIKFAIDLIENPKQVTKLSVTSIQSDAQDEAYLNRLKRNEMNNKVNNG